MVLKQNKITICLSAASAKRIDPHCTSRHAYVLNQFTFDIIFVPLNMQ
jgi:hypothetical protein